LEWIWISIEGGGEIELTAHREGERGKTGLLTRERKSEREVEPELEGDRRSSTTVIIGGEGGWRSPERARESQRDEVNEQLAWARVGEKILKTGYGHTGQSIVPVRCTPDSAQ
jgi:16S rRNA U1498 N3-methylase RsmE